MIDPDSDAQEAVSIINDMINQLLGDDEEQEFEPIALEYVSTGTVEGVMFAGENIWDSECPGYPWEDNERLPLLPLLLELVRERAKRFTKIGDLPEPQLSNVEAEVA